MKTFSYKVVLLFSLSLLSLPISVTAQAPHVDTIFTGVSHREPTLYYWGTNWVDMYPSWCGFNRATINDYSTEMARYCEVDSGYHLNVIGIAAPIEYYIPSGCYDTSISNRDPEYFNLYKPGINEGDTLVMNRLASARWDNCTPRYRMEIIKSRQG